MANITANKTLLSSFRHLFIIQKILPGVTWVPPAVPEAEHTDKALTV